jgi:hypothetical protein
MKNQRRGAPWKCRAVENAENQIQVSQAFPPALGNRNCDSHIPTAPAVSYFSSKRTKTTRQRSPALRPPAIHSSGSFTD